jgi:hypothetical protein
LWKCWTFAAIGGLDSNYYISKKLNTPISLSEKQIVDCPTFAGLGCYRGLSNLAYRYTVNGIMADSDYPYTSGSTGVAGKFTFN